MDPGGRSYCSVRALAAPPEVSGLIPSIRRVTHSHLKLQLVPGESDAFFWLLWASGIDIYILGKNTHKMINKTKLTRLHGRLNNCKKKIFEFM